MEPPSLTKVLWYTLSVVLLYLSLSFLHAQTPYTEAGDTNQSWSATTESQAANTNPTRTTESHKQSGNRTVDSQNVERLGPNGHYEPYFETEKESVQVTPTTARTVVRTFGSDGSGQKILTQVTEEERESLPGGNEKLVRLTSNSNLDRPGFKLFAARSRRQKDQPGRSGNRNHGFLVRWQRGHGAEHANSRASENQQRSHG